MTFGKFKSFIEKKLIESYRDEKLFKKNINQFKSEILEDKTVSKIYSIYDQISSPQGLTEVEAKEFLEEGVDLLIRLLPTVKLPKYLNEGLINDYNDIDVLVYNASVDIQERIKSRKNLVESLMKPKKELQSSVNLPIKTMVNVANQTIKNYVNNLDEDSKKELFKIIKEDQNILFEKFENLKQEGVLKLTNMMENEPDTETKKTIKETIEKLKTEKFDQVNFLKIKSLLDTI